MQDRRFNSNARNAVLSCLKQGRHNAQSQYALAMSTGYSPRTVREIIADLIFNTDALIGSSTEQSGGYYIIESAKELREAILHLYPREIEIRKRRQALEQKGYSAFGGQIYYDVQPVETGQVK